MVSIIIPTFNQAHYLRTAILSTLRQTYNDFEIIVVDDGSCDATQKAVREFKNSIKYIHQNHRGVAAARNAGINAARGDYIAFLDSDDLWFPHKLAQQTAFFDRCPKAKLVHCDGIAFLISGSFMTRRLSSIVKPVSGRLSWDKMLNSHIYMSAVVIKRELVDEIGLFDEDLEACEDCDFIMRGAERGIYIGFLKEPLILYRLHKHQLSQDLKKTIRYTIKYLDRCTHRDKSKEEKVRSYIVKLRAIGQ